MVKRFVACMVVLVILCSSISAYATKDRFEQIDAQPISTGEYLALQWMVETYDYYNWGFFGQMLLIMEVLHINTFLWVKYPW